MDYLNALLPLVIGLILAHNIDIVPDCMKAVTSNGARQTILYTQGAGLSVTVKKH